MVSASRPLICAAYFIKALVISALGCSEKVFPVRLRGLRTIWPRAINRAISRREVENGAPLTCASAEAVTIWPLISLLIRQAMTFQIDSSSETGMSLANGSRVRSIKSMTRKIS